MDATIHPCRDIDGGIANFSFCKRCPWWSDIGPASEQFEESDAFTYMYQIFSFAVYCMRANNKWNFSTRKIVTILRLYVSSGVCMLCQLLMFVICFIIHKQKQLYGILSVHKFGKYVVWVQYQYNSHMKIPEIGFKPMSWSHAYVLVYHNFTTVFLNVLQSSAKVIYHQRNNAGA